MPCWSREGPFECEVDEMEAQLEAGGRRRRPAPVELSLEFADAEVEAGQRDEQRLRAEQVAPVHGRPQLLPPRRELSLQLHQRPLQIRRRRRRHADQVQRSWWKRKLTA